MVQFLSRPVNAHTIKQYPAVLLNNIRDFIYPALCTVCDNPLVYPEPWLCNSCIDKLAINAQSRNACPRCAQNRERHTCVCTLVWDHPFERVISLFDYDDVVQALARQIKYQGRKTLAFYLGKRFASLIPADFLDGVDALVPVPLHFFRTMKRGYNQAEYFARGVAAGLLQKIPIVTNTLRRKKHTRTQTKLDKEQRERNLQDAFTVHTKHAHFIIGKRIILIDDVVTTGATTGQCAKVLLDAGAAQVRILSLARD